MTHWAIALYERYVQLYGEPIEQPIHADAPPSDAATPPRPAGALPSVRGAPARS